MVGMTYIVEARRFVVLMSYIFYANAASTSRVCVAAGTSTHADMHGTFRCLVAAASVRRGSDMFLG